MKLLQIDSHSRNRERVVSVNILHNTTVPTHTSHSFIICAAVLVFVCADVHMPEGCTMKGH